MRFPVVLHTDDGIRFGVTVPDLPGCFSSGDTFDMALVSVVEAIELHLEGIVEDGNDVPIPRPIAEHRINPDYSDGIWAAVEVNTARFDGREKMGSGLTNGHFAQSRPDLHLSCVANGT